MKQVLIIDGSPIFREYLTDKLTAEKIRVESAIGSRDAFIKLISILPDLVIIDVKTTLKELTEFLVKKQADPNAKSIPVILSGPEIEKEHLSQLIKFGVIKYFTTPIKFDIFFETIGRVLKEPFYLDTTPCVLDLHLNNNIVFIELAAGLNREKLSLLRFKIGEMIEANNLSNPKVVVMLTNLELCFVDATNLELLFDSIIANSKIQKKNIKILTLDSIVKELISGHPNYTGLEVVSNLSTVLSSLVDSSTSTNTSELITSKILAADRNVDQGSVEMRFSADLGSSEDESETGNVINVAIVDDDSVIRQLLQNSLNSIGANCSLFANGTDFLKSLTSAQYNLVILDIFMPGISGFEILKFLKKTPKAPPVLVYSQATQQNVVLQALSLGAKTFMIKPQKPEAIAKKVVEILNGKA